MEADIAVIAAMVIAFALVSRRVASMPLTMPMVFVAAGALTDWFGVVELAVETEGVAVLGEITLAIILFGDAARMDVRSLERQVGLPARLLLMGLPLTVMLGAVLFALLIPGLSGWEAALVAAILSPTDAALGQAVVEDRSVPKWVRQGLNVESGLNDGLAVPAVLLFIALATGEETDPGFWGRFILEQIGLGVVIGVACGLIGGALLVRAHRHGLVQGIYAQLATLSIAVLAFAGSEVAGANGFIAAFTAGLAFGAATGREKAEEYDEYTEDTGRLLAIASFFVFGNLFVVEAVGDTTVAVVACAVLALTVMRMAPVAVAMTGMGAAPQTKLFIGWFGPRGLASMLFGLQLLEEGVAEGLSDADELFAIIAWTVVASVVAHGATATWGARKYGEWYAAMSDHERDAMPESSDVRDRRVRWSLHRAPKV
ncbi:MAG: cation:proton antiporter [Ilumatobacter fluminis]|uniref:cation:proton antiporter n=1 Tax=Ilumatobacter fluminis TaxID=467091 RepID=UPI0032EA97FA